MKKSKFKWPFGQFQTRVLLCMILFAVIPSLSVGILSNLVARSAIQEVAVASSRDMLSRVCTDLDNLFENTYNIGLVVANDIDIQGILRSRFDTLYERYSADLRGDTRLNFISSYMKDIYGLYVIGENGCKHKSRFTSFKDGDFTQEEWYRTILRSDDPVWFGRHSGSFAVETIGDSLISGGFPIIDKATGQKAGIVLYDIAEQRLQELLQTSGASQASMLILDQDRGIITGSNEGMEPEYYASVRDSRDRISFDQDANATILIEDSNYLIQCQLSRITGWLLVAAVPKSVIFSRSRELGMLIGGMLVALCLLALFISVDVSHRLTRPVGTLMNAMRSVRHGDLTVSVATDRKDELGQLSESFNRMVAQVNELMEKSVQDEKRLRRAELVALQSQINPHFLYNTLDTVVWMARNGNQSGVVSMVTALTRFFRISLSKGRDFIPLSDELAHVESYLTIQRTRYENMLNYRVSVDEGCSDIQVPKLILQPLVENAIYHGIKLKENGGDVLIRCRMEADELVIEVEDTGIGMLPERLTEVLRSLEEGIGESDSYGLRNIHERLRICYGMAYGLEIDSEYLFGTTVRVRIPRERKEKSL